MSRAIRIELSVRNVLLFLAALIAFGAAVVAGARLVVRPAGHAEIEASKASSRENGHPGEEHADSDGKHEAGEAADGEHEEGRIKLSAAALKNAELELLAAGPGEVNVTLSLPGEVSLNQDTLAHVTPRVPGTAREVKKQVGELVKKGDLLAILDSRDLAEAQREFLATKERLALAKVTMERAESLKRENISAEKDYLAAKQALAETEIDHRSATQKLGAIGGGAGGGYALLAPSPGTIIEKHVSVGEVLGETTRAFTIADLSTIWVNVTVYAKDLPRVAVGQTAEVRAEGIAAPAHGTIVYLGQVVGEQTRSATARVVLKDPGAGWRPGLFATAEVTVDHVSAAVAVSDGALQSVEGKDTVFVQEGDAFEARPVKVGRRGRSTDERLGQVVEVLEGVKSGERYVSKNSFLLKAELGKSEAGHEH